MRTTRSTVRQLLLKAGVAAGHREFVGTPESFADGIERWIAADAPRDLHERSGIA